MKYIIVEDELGKSHGIVFSESLIHSEMARNVIKQFRREMKMVVEVVSAGFCSLGDLHCYGKSESLNLESRKEDSIIIQMGQ